MQTTLSLPLEQGINPVLYQELKHLWVSLPTENTYKDIPFVQIFEAASLSLQRFLSLIGEDRYRTVTQSSRWKLNQPYQGNIILHRIETPAIDRAGLTNVPHRIVRHSNDGLDWGTCCVGPRYDLALNALNGFFTLYEPVDPTVELIYQEFADQFLIKNKPDYIVIDQSTILKWIKTKKYNPRQKW